VNDFSSGGFLLQKYLHSKVNVIYFNDEAVISPTIEPLYFEKRDLPHQVSTIRELASEFDLFICFGWIAAAICYLANVNYVMYFVDSYIKPKDRIRKKMPFMKRQLVAELFSEAITHAGCLVTAIPRDVDTLKMYNETVRLVLPMVDPNMFNPNLDKIDLAQSRFTFFSPGRLDPGKNQDIVWESIRLTRSDFVVLQTDWGSGEYYEKLMSNRPEKIRIIPKIRREQIGAYYVSADAVLGQISLTTCGSIEREAALCGKPIFCYAPDCFTVNDPFYKGSLNPAEIADYLDKIVTDTPFRLNLAASQHEWVMEHFDNSKIAQSWEHILEETSNYSRKYKPKSHFTTGLKLFNLVSRNSN
jgi:glycosyltransferase involved in cell wall biosynthesis